jgi:LemA protein
MGTKKHQKKDDERRKAMQTILSFIGTLIGWAIFLGVIVVIVLWITYNTLQQQAQNVKEKNSNIQVALGKKISEINQLMTIIKGYQDFEQFTQLKVSADSRPAAMASAYQKSDATLTAIQMAVQKFPELQTSSQYHRVNDSIQNCEVNIQRNREIYTQAVKQYNSMYLAIPTVFIAPRLGFSQAPYLEFDTSGLAQDNALHEFKTDDGERLKQLLNQAGGVLADAGKTIVDKAGKMGNSAKD